MTIAGVLLVAGLGVFMAGAVAWKLEYQAPPAVRLPAVHGDRRRLRWIHRMMLAAMVVTPSGLAAVAAVSGRPAVWVAATAYTIGAVPWMIHLGFRATVQDRVAAMVAAGQEMPDWFEPIEAWAGLGYRIHMLVAYASAVPLAWGLAEVDLIPAWLAWSGAIWGVCWMAGFLAPRIRFAFEPPFWAHVFTFAVGLAIL